ncbi:hypothetical protein TSUD_325980 [Trifolium subterraneum]|uniref:Fe2OG dioxygenase domain-containing protein n=1 Tax=Trifolium subterraneum TaxID=3900 RepID=A0A2Z6LI92_TRISU|nr:hypothetical protein TSUD_325980 [Trifolium subterraneum]
MYGSENNREDSEPTAFRRAEKNYKLYYDNNASFKNKKNNKKPKPVDLTEVLDFRSILECHHRNGELPHGVIVLQDKDGEEWKFTTEKEASLRKFKSVSGSSLLRKLRWSTLGLQFDWSNRNYNVSLQHNKIPEALCELAKQLAKPALPAGVEFQPEAAIVNYFASGDTLGGHLDDMEADWSKPIVSLSLGCKAIFLLGGKSREDAPIAMFLRSGDVVLMAGEARECFHGVPRIFTDKENAEIGHLEKQLTQEDDLCFLKYIQTSRININIRQVF